MMISSCDFPFQDWLVVPTSSASPKSENGAEEKPGPSRAASARGKKKPAAATNAVPAAEVLRPAESSAVQPGPQPSAAETKLDSSTKAAAPGGVGKAADKENVNERCACARCGRTAAEAQVAKLKLCGGCRSVRAAASPFSSNESFPSSPTLPAKLLSHWSSAALAAA